MEEQRKHMDDLFRERLSGYRETDTGAVWSQLEQRLLAHKYRKIIPGWRWYIPALLFLVLGSVLIGWDYTGNAIGLVREGGRNAYLAVSNTVKESQPKHGNEKVTAQAKRRHGFHSSPAPAVHPASASQQSAYIQPVALTAAATSSTAATPLQRIGDALLAALPGTEATTLPARNINPAPASRQIDPAGAQLPLVTLVRNLQDDIVSGVKAAGDRLVVVQDQNLGAGKGGTGQRDVKPQPVPAAIFVAKSATVEVAPHKKDAIAKAEPLLAAAVTPRKQEPIQSATVVQTASLYTSLDNNTAAPQKPAGHCMSEGGIRAGIGFGLGNPQLLSADAGVYLQKKLSARSSLLARPALRYNHITTRNAESGTFYAVKDNQVDSTIWHSVSGSRYVNYYFSQEYDSIQVTYNLSKTTWELELPLLLQYKLAKRLLLQGGPVFSLGRNVQVVQSKATYNYVLADSIISQPYASSPNVLMNSFKHTVPEYDETRYANEAGMQFRWGYMLGLGYQLRPRLSIDLMLHQNLGGYSNISNPDVRSLYATPAIRLGVGYRMFGGN